MKRTCPITIKFINFTRRYWKRLSRSTSLFSKSSREFEKQLTEGTLRIIYTTKKGEKKERERYRRVRTSSAYDHKIAYHTQPTHDSRVRAHVLTNATGWCNVASITHPRFERPREMRMSAWRPSSHENGPIERMNRI